MCTNLFATAQQNFEVANYDSAITNLEQVMKMDEGYNDGAAMLLLAQSYEKKGDQDQANVKYQKIIESYPSTNAAEAAQQALVDNQLIDDALPIYSVVDNCPFDAKRICNLGLHILFASNGQNKKEDEYEVSGTGELSDGISST